MGIRNKPSQIAGTIKKIQEDCHPKLIYEYEKNMGGTKASTYFYWFLGMKQKILRFTGKTVYTFIKPNTINYRRMLVMKELYEVRKAMATKSKQQKRHDALKKMDKEDLLIIIESLSEGIDELEKEKSEKKQELIKAKCTLYIKISNSYNQKNRKINKRNICEFLDVPVRTLNDKISKNNIFSERKTRSDSIVHSQELNVLVNKAYGIHDGVYGQKRIYEYILQQGATYKFSTVCNVIRLNGFYANEYKAAPKKCEDKNTSIFKEYLVSKSQLKLYKPGEAFSIDFSQIETIYGKMGLHAARDIITKEIAFIFLCSDQTKETVLEHYKHLPPTTKVINTDHGSSYLSHDVQAYLESRNIKQSLGRVGCSYDNRGIEDFGKRIKYEGFQKYPTKNKSIREILCLIEDYKEFHNNVRLTKIDGIGTIPSLYATNFVK